MPVDGLQTENPAHRAVDTAAGRECSDAAVECSSIRRRIAVTVHALICIGMGVGMLAVGLYPFQAPRNGVSWLPDRDGVRLGPHATILSDQAFVAPGRLDSSAVGTVEIFLRPAKVNSSGTVLSFYTGKGVTPLSIKQFQSGLFIHLDKPNRYGQSNAGIDGVLSPREPRFITITSGTNESAIYVDGSLAARYVNFPLEGILTGQLILGTAPAGDRDWHGDLFGLAIYRSELTPEQVVRHYQTWIRGHRPETQPTEAPAAVYLFEERVGETIRNATGMGMNLTIPERYTLVHPHFLESFWTEYEPTLSYCRDLLINIAGFVPLGLALYLYWYWARPLRWAALATVGVGLGISLTIEVLQSYVPTRNSGTTDLFTNTLGTYLGMKLAGTSAAKSLIRVVYGASPISRRT